MHCFTKKVRQYHIGFTSQQPFFIFSFYEFSRIFSEILLLVDSSMALATSAMAICATSREGCRVMLGMLNPTSTSNLLIQNVPVYLKSTFLCTTELLNYLDLSFTDYWLILLILLYTCNDNQVFMSLHIADLINQW